MTKMTVMVGALVTLVIAVVAMAVWAVLNAAQCEVWESTGGMSCYGDSTYKTCVPIKRCVKYHGDSDVLGDEVGGK